VNTITNTLAAALAADGLGACFGWNAEISRHAETRTDLARIKLAAQTEQASRQIIEQELTHAQNRHAAEAAVLQTRVDAARARADAAAHGLRRAAAAAAASAQCADSPAADLGAATGDAIGVLADVLGRADARAGELADLADQRYFAGRACEREYDAAREALTKD
jgi:hypothetical protein